MKIFEAWMFIWNLKLAWTKEYGFLGVGSSN